MKKITYLLFLLFASYANAAEIVFPDMVFKQQLLLASATNNIALDSNGNSIKIDLDDNGEITTAEALAVFQLDVSSSNISDLTGIEYFVNITSLDCKVNQLTTLDVSTLFTLSNLDCSTNLLTSLFIKNGIAETLDLSGNAGLSYICADGDQVAAVQLQVPVSCEVNSYCTLPPGGDYDTITGLLVYDANNNGINPSDPRFPYVKLKCVIGTDVYQTVTNANGEYTFYLQQTSGSFTISPELENPGLLNLPLPSVTNNLTGTNLVQNFTITPIPVPLPDLEVVIAPVSQALPNASSIYKVVYTNKGSKPVNGRVILTYDTSILSFLSASDSNANDSAGQITLLASNMRPYETRDFDVVFNVSPTAVIGNSIGFNITYYELISITELLTDLSDNVFNYTQVIGNTPPVSVECLEGTNVSPSLIGDYLHYMINFKNMSNVTIQNVMINNMFDTTQFDMSSLEILYASHPLDFQAKNNNAEYAFRNADLGGPGGHGGILLKIKTNDNLPDGSLVVNNAGIFYDYNGALNTNVEQTVFQLLGVNENNTDPSIVIYPNPTVSLINVSANNLIKSVELYDVQAKLLQIKSIDVTKTILDISDKPTGVYYLKITSEKGIKVHKILKKEL